MYRSDSQQKTGLSTKFEQFRQEIELTPNQRQRIINSHIHLRQNNLIRLHYVSDSFLTGSYKRHTMIRPPNDVDIFVLINHGRYEVTPNTVLNKLRLDLRSSYPNSVVRQDKPCIVLDFNHCKFELTPAIKVSQDSDRSRSFLETLGRTHRRENQLLKTLGGGQSHEGSQYADLGYYIPSQAENTWMKVESPRVLEERLSNANQRLNGMLTPLIKMMKVCKRYNNLKAKKSFELEDIAINSLSYIANYRDGVQKLLRAYNWTNKSLSYYEIESMTDQEFASYCRETLFGNDFPE